VGGQSIALGSLWSYHQASASIPVAGTRYVAKTIIIQVFVHSPGDTSICCLLEYC